MKIVFTNSPLYFPHGHVFLQPDWPTLILPALAGIVGKKHEVSLVDNSRGFFRSNVIREQIRKINPDIVGFSIIAAVDIFNTLRIIRQVRREFPRLILLAGGQAGSYYDQILHKNGIDFVVHGEGEVTLPELIAAIENKVPDYSGIKGISYLADGTVRRTPERPFLKNLDDSPFPAVELMPQEKSRWFAGRFTGSIEMSRGCPFDCNFCAITQYWKRSFREKSNERILEELRILKRYHRTHIYLADDNFAMNVKKNSQLFESIVQEKLDLKFFAQIRADTIANNPEMMEGAAEAGMYGALVGFDTYDPDTYQDITKVGSAELNTRASQILRKNGIAVFGSHVYGFPGQKEPKDFNDTFWKGRRYSDIFRMSLFSPHPGTKLHQELAASGQIDPEQGSSLHKLLVGDERYQKKMTRGYYLYQLIHAVLPDEILGALFHRNPVIRKLKFYGYVAAFRIVFYKILLKLKLSDI